jgi:hypothetical protein
VSRRILAPIAATAVGMTILMTGAWSASAATVPAADVAFAASAARGTPAVPDTATLYRYYSTLAACRAAGQLDVFHHVDGAYSYYCVEYTDGAYFEWGLWLLH